MPNHDIIVVGGSAGAIDPLQTLVADLPESLPATVFVVVHLAAAYAGALTRVLGRKSKLPVHEAANDRKFEKGHIYVAVPDHHLLLENDRMIVARSPKENRNRPALDPLFRAAALNYRSRVIGVVLSGVLDDGTSGLWHIKRLGGIAVVQSPEDASFSEMPRNALENVAVDHCVPRSEMGTLLARLVDTNVEASSNEPQPATTFENQVACMQTESNVIREMFPPSRYTCPDCQGTLFELRDGDRQRFRCRTGHAYELNSLLYEQSERAENALWGAIRALQEKADLLRTKSIERGDGSDRERLRRLADVAGEQARALREIAQSIEAEPIQP